jgi:GNAT superfamily N-acetyltransferase
MNQNNLVIDSIRTDDIPVMVAAYSEMGWPKKTKLYSKYIQLQQDGTRDILIARYNSSFAGYLTNKWQSDYPPFNDAGIPEINDFSVLAHLRKKKIGSRLMDEAESRIKQRASSAGIGVGLTPDYGPAQRLYARRGYVPDGRGLMVDDVPVSYEQVITVGDQLVLYFTKLL